MSDTFAPPRIATSGRSGEVNTRPRYSSSFSISKPGGWLLNHVRDRLDRCVGPVRGAERVVHIQIGQRRELFRERRIVLFFFGVKSQILEKHDATA